MIYEGVQQQGRSRDRALAEVESFVRRNPHRTAACAIAVGVIVYMLYLYTRFPLPPGTDAGQWLAVSRFYLGENVPDGRSVATVPPVVPLILAVLSLLGGSTGAIAGIAVLCYGLIATLAYRLGERLTGEASGGLLSLVAVAVIQNQLFEFFAMGAFPQLLGIAGMGLALHALLGLAKRSEDSSEWLALAGGTALTLFSHTPSATVLIPVLALCVAYVYYSSNDRAAMQRRAIVTLGPVFALWAGFLFMNRDVIFGYAGVDAAYELKGPDKLVHIIWKDNTQRLVFMAGLAATAVLPFLIQDNQRKRLRGHPEVLLAIWTGGLIAIVAFAAARHTGTDYPRFIAYFVMPLGLAAAACVQSFKPNAAVVAALLVPVLLFGGHDAMRHFNTATRFYGVNERAESLNEVASWLDARPGNSGVIAGTRETKWLEALTGRDSLLYLPRIYITRPWEVERALEAEVVHRSSGGIETGRMLITANDGGQDFGKVFPDGVRVDLFSSGMYKNLMSLRDQTAAVNFIAYGATKKMSLGAMENRGTSAWEDASGKHLVTTFVAEDAPISVVRVVTADSIDQSTVLLEYYVGAPEGVRPDSVVIGTGESGGVEIKPGGSDTIYADLPAGEIVEVGVRTSWEGGALPPRDANPFLTWRKATMSLNVGQGERRVPYAALLDPLTILEHRNVRYIVDRDGDGAAFPIIRDLALEPVYSNSVYRVYEVPSDASSR